MSSASRNACGKLAFRTKADAKRMRRRIKGAGGRKIYLCPDCGSWHLTSMSLTEQLKHGHRAPDARYVYTCESCGYSGNVPPTLGQRYAFATHTTEHEVDARPIAEAS